MFADLAHGDVKHPGLELAEVLEQLRLLGLGVLQVQHLRELVQRVGDCQTQLVGKQCRPKFFSEFFGPYPLGAQCRPPLLKIINWFIAQKSL